MAHGYAYSCHPGAHSASPPHPSRRGILLIRALISTQANGSGSKTYGAKLVENVTQAAVHDVLVENMPLIEDAGYSIVLTVHDELICKTPNTDEFNDESLSELLSTPPEWAPDLPLNAAGFEAVHYHED